MSSLKFFMIFVFLLSLSSSLFTFTIAQTPNPSPNYLNHFCSNNTFTRNSTYQTNLNLVLSSLASNSNGSDGFSNATAGQNPNRVYGLFQCRNDLNTSTCQNCVVHASTEVTQRCPTEKGNIIWYDECLLHYSDSNIFSTVTTSPTFSLLNTEAATDPTRFDELVLGLMNASKPLAANNTKRYATRDGISTNSSERIYTFQQCTQDLSSDDCSRCLEQAIANLPKGKIGGRRIFPSCYSMFELFDFYTHNKTASPPPAPTTLSPPSPVTRPTEKRRISTSVIIAIVAPITVSAVLLMAGYCFLTRRARKKDNSLPAKIDISTVESLQFDFGTIQAATNGFSTDNKLGEGGFGVVYKGVLSNGQEIAVKRLSRSSGQVDQTQGTTNRIVGTYGYMSPEYAMHGQFSVKSDVFSFGVLILEIITGKKTTNFYQTDGAEDLLNYVWKHWRDGTPTQFVSALSFKLSLHFHHCSICQSFTKLPSSCLLKPYLHRKQHLPIQLNLVLLLLPPTPTAAMDYPTPPQGKNPTGSMASFNAAATSTPPPAKTALFTLPQK
ncbi:hypothetical protein LWI28_017912 [Acer negundo]|uniref:Gnk2-homologous domain-containing protein n=1 Tax=Acer negundo TaxID=4023 RepID=A0AAD5P3E9_ACENE|nr:hypothetical protein LWI28_017912 [Acer negundo]